MIAQVKTFLKWFDENKCIITFMESFQMEIQHESFSLYFGTATIFTVIIYFSQKNALNCLTKCKETRSETQGT